MPKAHKRFAHELIASTAKEFAGAYYEELAHDNEFYAFYPSQKKFIKREWHRFTELARKQLALMLGFSVTPEWQKEQIFEALIKHASLPGNVDPRVAKQMIDAGDIPNLEKVH